MSIKTDGFVLYAVLMDCIRFDLLKWPLSGFVNVAFNGTYNVKEDLAGVDSVQQLAHMVLLIEDYN